MDEPAADTPAAPGAESVLASLHTLLRAHVAAHPNPTAPYLHPYAPLPPAPWKGKGRAALPTPSAQLELLRKIRESVEASRAILSRRDEERTKLARSMREVITHESTLLPLGTTLLSLPPAARPLAALCVLPPSDLLSALGRRLDLQVFAEDSQFGLLRTSLTLAGSRFVVDVDLEADSMGESEPPTAAGTPAFGTPAFPPLTPLTFGGAPERDRERERLTGQMRVAKLSANHITPAGEDGKSEWIAKVLRGLLEAHLAKWNECREADEDVALETLLPSAEALEQALAEVKVLDELAEGMGKGEVDLFADLEALGAGLEEGLDGAGEVVPGLFPAFRLAGGPVLRFRPERRGESVPTVKVVSEGVEGMAVDGEEGEKHGDGQTKDANTDTKEPDPMEDMVGAGLEAVLAGVEPEPAPVEDAKVEETVEPMCRGRWLIEVDDTSSGLRGGGIPVRRTWLLPNPSEEDPWPSSVKIEELVYASQLAQSQPTFPYGGDFVHPGAVAQHWSQVAPGPEGFMVGRIGLPASWGEFRTVLRVLGAQVVLDELFASAFAPGALGADSDDGGGEDGGDDDMVDLDQAPSAIPLTVTLQQRSMRVSLPLPRGDSPTVTLEFRPTDQAPFYALAFDAEDIGDELRQNVAAALAGAVSDSSKVDAVAAVSRFLSAL